MPLENITKHDLTFQLYDALGEPDIGVRVEVGRRRSIAEGDATITDTVVVRTTDIEGFLRISLPEEDEAVYELKVGDKLPILFSLTEDRNYNDIAGFTQPAEVPRSTLNKMERDGSNVQMDTMEQARFRAAIGAAAAGSTPGTPGTARTDAEIRAIVRGESLASLQGQLPPSRIDVLSDFNATLGSVQAQITAAASTGVSASDQAKIDNLPDDTIEELFQKVANPTLVSVGVGNTWEYSTDNQVGVAAVAKAKLVIDSNNRFSLSISTEAVGGADKTIAFSPIEVNYTVGIIEPSTKRYFYGKALTIDETVPNWIQFTGTEWTGDDSFADGAVIDFKYYDGVLIDGGVILPENVDASTPFLKSEWQRTFGFQTEITASSRLSASLIGLGNTNDQQLDALRDWTGSGTVHEELQRITASGGVTRSAVYGLVKDIIVDGSDITSTDDDTAETVSIAYSGTQAAGDDAFDWATEGNTDTIPDAKIASNILRENQYPIVTERLISDHYNYSVSNAITDTLAGLRIAHASGNMYILAANEDGTTPVHVDQETDLNRVEVGDTLEVHTSTKSYIGRVDVITRLPSSHRFQVTTISGSDNFNAAERVSLTHVAGRKPQDDIIEPQMLRADSNSDKEAFRERIGASVLSSDSALNITDPSVESNTAPPSRRAAALAIMSVHQGHAIQYIDNNDLVDDGDGGPITGQTSENTAKINVKKRWKHVRVR